MPPELKPTTSYLLVALWWGYCNPTTVQHKLVNIYNKIKWINICRVVVVKIHSSIKYTIINILLWGLSAHIMFTQSCSFYLEKEADVEAYFIQKDPFIDAFDLTSCYSYLVGSCSRTTRANCCTWCSNSASLHMRNFSFFHVVLNFSNILSAESHRTLFTLALHTNSFWRVDMQTHWC